jgi:hypothetical protein
MSASGIVLIVTALIVLPLAWMEWARRRQDKSKPFQFSMAGMFGVVSFVCVASWLVISIMRKDPIGFGLAALIEGSLLGVGIELPFHRPWLGAFLGALVAACALLVAFYIWISTHIISFGGD